MAVAYYISTGDTGSIYTLRGRTGNRGDFFICSLRVGAGSEEEALLRAKTYLVKRGWASSEFTPPFYKKATKMTRTKKDWAILQGGKYQGKSVFDVYCEDRDYCLWLMENMANSATYSKTIKILKDEINRAVSSAPSGFEWD